MRLKDKIFSISDYRREFNNKYCEIADVLMWGESDSLIPRQTFNILDYIQEIGYPGELEFIWVKKECGDPTLWQEVEPPAKWKVGKWKKFEKTHRREEKSTRRFKVMMLFLLRIHLKKCILRMQPI